jgi:hypothetical protein
LGEKCDGNRIAFIKDLPSRPNFKLKPMLTIDVPNFLEEAFNKGYSYIESADIAYNFYAVHIGLLNVPSGKIIACDPFIFNEDEPFTIVFPIGQFPVELSIAKINNDERIGFARVRFSDNVPINWAMAVCGGQDVTILKPKEFFGYGVDAGTGAFMDETNAKVFSEYLAEKDDNFEKIIDEMEKTYKHTRSWLLWGRHGSDVAMFSSGWGDGHYATYIGHDIDNNICRLVTDFGLLDWPE